MVGILISLFGLIITLAAQRGNSSQQAETMPATTEVHPVVFGGLEAVMMRLAGMPGTPLPNHSHVTVRMRCTLPLEVLLTNADPDGNEALSFGDRSSAGVSRNRTASPDRVTER
ncbi:hypothetical protein [Streptomyces sp. NPDC017941]|uniref:hypothetical protein n=1 Tax=Streptomyces sp. NPDC017941 TaxID=3365018 RepID=UPI0037B2C521